jgi:hypothetical protein
MLSQPIRLEIDHRTMKLVVGLIALFLACFTAFFAQEQLASISASYHAGGWARDIFIGSLFAIAAFLLAYNGESRHEMLMSKVAAVAAILIALFPCACGDHDEIIPRVHAASAATMFLILAGFCYIFLRRALAKHHAPGKRRATIYALCAIAIIAAILVMALDHMLGEPLSKKIERLTYYCETTGLVAFGVSWLTASRVLPWITGKGERFSPLS